VSFVVGCATSVPVECPEGFELTDNNMDCVPVAPGDPDAGPFGDPPTCQELDCNDGNECTVDGCADASCTNEAIEDGTACTANGGEGLCLGGQCVADCSKQDCRPVYPCTEQGIRDAIRDGGDVIIGCEVPTTVTLSEGILEIDNELSLDGLGNLTIDADQKSRVFLIHAPAVVELIAIGITGGLSPADPDVNWRNGGAIWTQRGAQLTIRRCRLFGNISIRHGGSLQNSGTTTIIDSELTENAAENRGGAISGNRDLTILDSLISGNHALEDGGALYHSQTGVVSIERSTITDNVAEDTGGGIWTSGTLLTVKDSVVSDNVAGNGGGGIRLWTSAEVRVIDSTIARNLAIRGYGGGVVNHIGLLSLERALVTRNAAPNGRGAGVYNEEDSIFEAADSILSENVAEHGGAVYSLRSTVRLVRSAVIDNVAAGYGGAIRIYGRGPGDYDLSLENCTIAGNEAGEIGGGVTTRNAVLWRLVHSTLVGNEAPIGAAIQQDRETIVELASSAIHASCDNSEDSPLSSLGFNAVLDLGAETCMLTGGETDQVLSDEDMSLGVLGDNGGPTPSHIPNPGSLLIDAIPAESCDPAILEDQRGEPRGGASPCDIGAVEVQASD
jgi:hypothetical protein